MRHALSLLPGSGFLPARHDRIRLCPTYRCIAMDFAARQHRAPTCVRSWLRVCRRCATNGMCVLACTADTRVIDLFHK